MNRISCPACGHRLKYADEHQGKKARCQGCGHSFRLPVAVPVPGPAPNSESDLGFFESPPDGEQEPAPAPRGSGRQSDTEPGRRMWPWVAAVIVALVALGVGEWAATRGEKPKPAVPAPTPGAPGTPVSPVAEPDRYDGEWTGSKSDDHWVDGIIIDKNEFPCTGAVRIGSANVTASVPVLWTREKDVLVGTDNRGAPAVGPALARIRLAKGLLSGEAKAPDGTLFIPPGTKTFAGFKRTGPPPVPKASPSTPPKLTPTPAELIVGKWSGQYPIKKISGEVEALEEIWEFEKAGTFRRVIMLGGATATQEGPYRVVDEKSLELGTSGSGVKLVWKMTLTPDALVIAHPTQPQPGAVGAGTSTLRRAK